jgi:anti-sigma regulatory factor (Ser/Thr protein kinase)
VEISLSLNLPRDEETIPVARHIVRRALAEVGVENDCTFDVELALSEACTNVLRHAGLGEAYEVRLQIDERSCELRVVDVGRGFDTGGASAPPRGVEEGGRGLGLMIALVDKVQFASRSETGTVVSLEKALVYRENSIGSRRRSRPDTPALP